MQLLFYLGNDLIEAVNLQPEKIALPGYLGSFKRSLQQKYNWLIAEESTPPEFLIVHQNLSAAQAVRN